MLKRANYNNSNSDDDVLQISETCSSVRELENLCISKGLKLPVYRIMKIETTTNAKLFTIACVLEKMTVRAKGSSEKTAKQEAAHKMLKMVRPMSEDALVAKFNKSANCIDQAKTDILKKMKENPSEAVAALRAIGTVPTGLASLVFLQNIATENNFSIKFIDFQKNGQFDCLLELSLQTVTVIQGRGNTVQAARFDAAENALGYLKHVLVC
ncbi:RISC-loading complex subunit tarbp2 [Chamberlinius hualienensis]